MSTKKVTILTGPPLSSSLRWDETELTREILPCFLGRDSKSLTSPESSSVRWRVIKPLVGLDSSAPEDKVSFTEETSFFAATDLSTAKSAYDEHSFENMDDLSQFYDHSFAIHEDLSSSQMSIPVSSGTESLDDSYWDDSTVELADQSSHDGHQSSAPCLPSLLGPLNDLAVIPNAAYLRSINPQTMTVNLIVTIISIYPRRRIKTRFAGREMDIVEMVTADETKSGFGITFWLQPAEQDSMPQDALGISLNSLRPRDIILLRTVALNFFKDKVHGQSLRKDMTKIDLLHRHPVEPTDETGIYSTNAIINARESDPHLLKIRRVRDWIMDFVGSNIYENVETRVHPVGHRKTRLLPPDTQ